MTEQRHINNKNTKGLADEVSQINDGKKSLGSCVSKARNLFTARNLTLKHSVFRNDV